MVPGFSTALSRGPGLGAVLSHVVSSDTCTLLTLQVAAIVDGALSWRRPGGDNSSVQEPYPSIVVAAWQQDTGAYHTFQGSLSGPRLYTTTNTVLNQSFVYLDAFQVQSSCLQCLDIDQSTSHN